VRPEKVRIIDVERIPFVACRMIGRDVQRLEVVVLGLDLRAGGKVKPHPHEDRLDLPLDDRQRMEMPQLSIDAGEGDVDPLAGEAFLEVDIGELLLPGSDGLGRLLLQGVQEAPRFGAGFRIDLADQLEQPSDPPLPTEELYPERLEPRRIGQGG